MNQMDENLRMSAVETKSTDLTNPVWTYCDCAKCTAKRQRVAEEAVEILNQRQRDGGPEWYMKSEL